MIKTMGLQVSCGQNSSHKKKQMRMILEWLILTCKMIAYKLSSGKLVYGHVAMY